MKGKVTSLFKKGGLRGILQFVGSIGLHENFLDKFTKNVIIFQGLFY
jgi:hypothetical protein